MLSCGAFPWITRMCRQQRTVCRLGATLLLAANALVVSGQMMRRPALFSGSASVVLIARVESLSVVANQEAAAGPVVAGEPFAALPISITTSWAVPANFTTFRLSEYFGLPTATSAAPAGGGPGSVEGPARPVVEGGSVLVVDSGGTNEAKTRTDELNVVPDPGSAGKPGEHEEGGLLNILVQAL